MGLRSWLSERFQGEPTEVVAQVIPSYQQNQPLAPVHDFRSFGQDGYRRNVVIFACIRELATSAPEAHLQVGRYGQDDQFEPFQGAHPLKSLLARPNPTQSGNDFQEQLTTFYYVAGNAFLHKVRSGAGRVVQLWNLRPDRIEIVPGPNGEVIRYDYNVGARKQPIPASDVIHFKETDPLDDYWGLSRLAVLARQGDIDNSISDFVRAFFLNGGQPIGMFVSKSRIKKSERERIKREYREEYTGLHGWHVVAVVSGDVEYKEIGARPDRVLGIESLTDLTESRICAAFNVPPQLVGVRVGIKRQVYNTYKEARRSFWEDELVPYRRRLDEKLTTELASEFRDDLVIRSDLGSIQALQEDFDARYDRAIKGWDSGLLTRNQALKMIGYEEAEGGDVYKMGAQDILLPVGELPAGNGNGQQSLPNRSVIFLDPYSMEWLDLPEHKVRGQLPATTESDKKKDS